MGWFKHKHEYDDINKITDSCGLRSDCSLTYINADQKRNIISICFEQPFGHTRHYELSASIANHDSFTHLKTLLINNNIPFQELPIRKPKNEPVVCLMKYQSEDYIDLYDDELDAVGYIKLSFDYPDSILLAKILNLLDQIDPLQGYVRAEVTSLFLLDKKLSSNHAGFFAKSGDSDEEKSSIVFPYVEARFKDKQQPSSTPTLGRYIWSMSVDPNSFE